MAALVSWMQEVVDTRSRVLGLLSGTYPTIDPESGRVSAQTVEEPFVDGDWQELRGLTGQAFQRALRRVLAGPAATADGGRKDAEPGVRTILRALDRLEEARRG